jgi:hypothetical protein
MRRLGDHKKMTEDTAMEAVNQIRPLIAKARSAAKQQEEKNKEIGDVAKKQ